MYLPIYPFICQTFCPFTYLPIYLSISTYLPIYPSIHLSIYPSIHLSIYLSTYQPSDLAWFSYVLYNVQCLNGETIHYHRTIAPMQILFNTWNMNMFPRFLIQFLIFVVLIQSKQSTWTFFCQKLLQHESFCETSQLEKIWQSPWNATVAATLKNWGTWSFGSFRCSGV